MPKHGLLYVWTELLYLICGHFNSYNVTKTHSIFVNLNFYIFNVLGQNFASWEFWDWSKRPKSVISGILSKIGWVWATPWPTFSELKIKFGPSLDRS